MILPIARRTAARFAEAQLRSHVVPTHGSGQLERWAAGPARRCRLAWWEWAGGAAASVLGLHALLSAGCRRRTTRTAALRLDHAYLLCSAMTTMLDSLIDDQADAAGGQHRYVAYYPDHDAAGCRIATLARRAAAAGAHLAHPSHHALTVIGIASYYLSAPAARRGPPRAVGRRVLGELGPIAIPVLAVFRLWRRVG